MKNNNNNSLIGVLLMVIVGLFYYLYNKRRLDYQFNEILANESEEAVKDYYVDAWNDLKNVWNGNKNYFGK